MSVLESRRSLKVRHLHSLVRYDPVRPAGLEIANDLAMAVHLDAAQDILRPSNASKVRRVPLVAQVHPAASARTAGTALTARTASSCSAGSSAATLRSPLPPVGLREEGPAGPKHGAAGAGESLCLAYEVLVMLGVFGEHVVEDLEEATVLPEGVRGRGDGCGRAYRKVVVWRIGVEIGQDVGAGVGTIWESLLHKHWTLASDCCATGISAGDLQCVG